MWADPSSVLKLDVADAEALGMHRHLELEIENQGIAIRPVGYGDKLSMSGQGCPILVEFRNGIPTVIIWDDINREEPSHVISLRNAAESNRRDSGE